MHLSFEMSLLLYGFVDLVLDFFFLLITKLSTLLLSSALPFSFLELESVITPLSTLQDEKLFAMLKLAMHALDLTMSH